MIPREFTCELVLDEDFETVRDRLFLTMTTDADLHAEVARRRQAKRKSRRGGKPPIINACHGCGSPVNARQRWAGCPQCGAHTRKK
jgi:rubrerythrin